jgi:4-hydroxybenzoate polyprenyltransferase
MVRPRRRIARLAGALAFARPGNWFVSKIPPLLAIAYLDILRFGIAPLEAVPLLACGLVSIFCVAIYGHVVNDIFDLEADRLANKPNRLAAMRPAWRVLLAAAFLTGGFLPALVVHYSAGATALLLLNYVWPTIYSIPLVRLKERGLLGVACDALGSHVTPTLFILVLFARATPDAAADFPAPIAIVATLWAALLGLKGILHHQISDRDNDLRSGIETFATRSGVASLQRFLTRFNLAMELPISALFALMAAPWCPLAIPALLLYTGSEAAKYKLGFQFALTPDPATIRASVPFTNEMFYVLWLPMAAAIQLGLYHLALFWLPLLHGLVFRRPAAQQVADWHAILQQAAPSYRARFTRNSDPRPGPHVEATPTAGGKAEP